MFVFVTLRRACGREPLLRAVELGLTAAQLDLLLLLRAYLVHRRLFARALRIRVRLHLGFERG